MFIKASRMPRKPYISFAYVTGSPETLILKGHKSLGLAQIASRRNSAKVREARTEQQTGALVEGWSMVTNRDRVHGKFL